MTKTAAQLLRETMDAINNVGSQAPVEEAIGRKYQLETTIANPIPGDEPEIEVGVNYTMEGKYYPATFDAPAEYPEINDIQVYDLTTGKDISDLLPESVFDKLDDECWEHYSNEPRRSVDEEVVDESVGSGDMEMQTSAPNIYADQMAASGTPEDDIPEEIDVTVSYSIFGKDRPATFHDPAEYAELDIVSVTDEQGNDITSALNSQFPMFMKNLEQKCWEHADAMKRDSFQEPDDMY